MQNKSNLPHPEHKKPWLTTRQIVWTALFTAILAVLSIISIPVGMVPVSLSVFALFLIALLLPMRCGVMASVAYLLLGVAGVPVFAGMTAGPGRLFGVTGGYLFSYPLMVVAACLVIKLLPNFVGRLLGLAAALFVCYLLGTIWFCIQPMFSGGNAISFWHALSVCVVPFLPFDFAKLAAALGIFYALLIPLKKMHLWPLA